MFRLDKLSRYSATAAFVMGGFFASLYFSPYDHLRTLAAVSMKFNTCIGTMASAISCLFLLQMERTKNFSFKQSWISWTLSLLVISLGALTLAEYIFNWDLGIDQFFTLDVLTPVTWRYPGRMSPIAACGLILIALANISVLWNPLRQRNFHQKFILVLMCLAILALIGYLYNVDSFYQIGTMTRISMCTSINFLLQSIALLSLRPNHGFMRVLTSPSAGGISARRLLIAALAIPPIIGWLRLKGEALGLFSSTLGTSLSVITHITVFSTFIYFSAKAQNEIDEERMEAKERLHLALSAADLGTWRGDALTRKSSMDAGLNKILGFPEVESQNNFEDYIRLVHPDDREICSRTLQEAIQARKNYLATYRIIRPSGEIRWLRNQARVISGPDGRTSIIGTAVDITDVKLAELEKSRLLAREQEAVRARDEFLSIASHELKTPLTTLKLQAQIAKRKLTDGPGLSQEALLKSIEGTDRQIERLTRLIDDMLDISRLQSGNLSLKFESFDLCELVRDTIERLTPQMQAAGCVVTLQANCTLTGNWDRLRIEQVFTNVLTNAQKYGAKKPIEISVYLNKSNMAQIDVRDYGMGISPENQERIFQRFERAIPMGEISGLGLGLYITRQILQLHGGDIRVQSQLGQGSTFTIELPLSS